MMETFEARNVEISRAILEILVKFSSNRSSLESAPKFWVFVAEAEEQRRWNLFMSEHGQAGDHPSGLLTDNWDDSAFCMQNDRM